MTNQIAVMESRRKELLPLLDKHFAAMLEQDVEIERLRNEVVNLAKAKKREIAAEYAVLQAEDAKLQLDIERAKREAGVIKTAPTVIGVQ